MPRGRKQDVSRFTVEKMMVGAKALPPVRELDEMIFQLGTDNWQRKCQNGSGLEFALGSGVLHDRVIVAPNGIGMDTFKPARKDLRTVLKEQTRTILWPAKKGSLWGACTDGDGSAPTEADMEKYKRCVTFVGKAAEWKRQAACCMPRPSTRRSSRTS